MATDFIDEEMARTTLDYQTDDLHKVQEIYIVYSPFDGKNITMIQLYSITEYERETTNSSWVEKNYTRVYRPAQVYVGYTGDDYDLLIPRGYNKDSHTYSLRTDYEYDTWLDPLPGEDY